MVDWINLAGPTATIVPKALNEAIINGRELLLAERELTHGDYVAQSQLQKAIDDLIAASRNYKSMPAYMRNSLDKMAEKISRACEGDPYWRDHWDDVRGSAILVLEQLDKEAAGACGRDNPPVGG